MSEHVTTPATAASPAGRRPAGGFWWATAVTGVAVVAIGVFGTLAHRGFGRVPFSVPAWPWYHSDPFYLFWDPRWPSGWGVIGLAAALAAAGGVVALFRSQARPGVRVAASAGLLLVLALAVAALDGGSAAWRAPLAFTGESIGAWLADRDQPDQPDQRRRAVAVDGKTLRGARRAADGRQATCWPRWTTPPAPSSPKRQVDGAPGEVPAFQPLLADLDLAGAVVTADALHTHPVAAEFLVTSK